VAERTSYERRGAAAILTIERPERRNAVDRHTADELLEAYRLFESDDDARVLVLTGAGDLAFCAGADLKAMTQSHPGKSFEGGGWDLTRIDALLKGRRLTKPLIAAVEGPAIAGGTEILQATDIRVAGEGARFGVSEARWGLFPLGGSAVRLVRQVPYTLAADILLTGRHLSATEAWEIGLVGRVVPDGQALDTALEIAERVAANGPLAVQAILQTIRDTEGMAEDDAFEIEAEIGMRVFMSEDAKEGPRAFADKRTPEFSGR
jgi:enoyl-CoA hydratase